MRFNVCMYSSMRRFLSRCRNREDHPESTALPGVYREWLMGCACERFKRWGVPARQIADLRTVIEKVD